MSNLQITSVPDEGTFKLSRVPAARKARWRTLNATWLLRRSLEEHRTFRRKTMYCGPPPFHSHYHCVGLGLEYGPSDLVNTPAKGLTVITVDCLSWHGTSLDLLLPAKLPLSDTTNKNIAGDVELRRKREFHQLTVLPSPFVLHAWKTSFMLRLLRLKDGQMRKKSEVMFGVLWYIQRDCFLFR